MAQALTETLKQIKDMEQDTLIMHHEINKDMTSLSFVLDHELRKEETETLADAGFTISTQYFVSSGRPFRYFVELVPIR